MVVADDHWKRGRRRPELAMMLMKKMSDTFEEKWLRAEASAK